MEAIENPMIEFPQNVSDPIEALIGISRFYGSDPTIVLAGGGNTSVKINNVLHVKASGFALATIGREGFVALDRAKLQAVADADFGSNTEQREIAYKNGIMNSRLEPEKNQRPSVEALLHHLVPGKFVVHTHATLVNTVTCAANGEKIARELFGDAVLWIPFVDPGYTLGRALKEALAARKTPPQAIFMANHGLIVAGDEPQQIKDITDRLLKKISDKLG
jgi:rhamnose utilization protein RhaD (predicted bifunctional aldolase and dehydrogenase)